jgi:hypothetical protein
LIKSVLSGISLAIAFVLAGCATSSGGRGGEVTELHLFGLPVTLNLDAKPGADGFAVRVYATKNGGAKGAEVTTGSLEIQMFDGVVGMAELIAQTPQQTWKFNARELARYEEQTSLGHGYKFALRWDQMPKRKHITVLARYVSPKGEPIYSSPSTITASTQ